LSIGTELLLGQILNTNEQYMTGELAEIGIDCYRNTTVGDNKTRIKDCLREALQRVDIVITTGGLGPTADDLTHECIAETLGVPLEFDEKVMRHIEELFKRRGFVMVESNRKQAQRPQGADLLFNPVGTAPGIIWEIKSELLANIGVTDVERSRYVFTFP